MYRVVHLNQFVDRNSIAECLEYIGQLTLENDVHSPINIYHVKWQDPITPFFTLKVAITFPSGRTA